MICDVEKKKKKKEKEKKKKEKKKVTPTPTPRFTDTLFPLFEGEQSLQLHQSIHKLFPQDSISSSICWYMKWLVAKRPKLIVLLF